MDRDEIAAGLEALHPDSFGWALACCGRDGTMAEEALQLSYLKIIEGKARFDGRSSLKTWLFAVIRNTAADLARRRRRERSQSEPLGGDERRPQEGPGPEAGALARERAEIVRDRLARLSSRQQEILHLVFYQGLTLDEAAAVLGVTPGSARAHYARAKRRLKDLLPCEVRP